MIVRELIFQLEKVNPNAEVHTGYDGNIVCERVGGVREVKDESDAHECWWHVKVGDVVILCK